MRSGSWATSSVGAVITKKSRELLQRAITIQKVSGGIGINTSLLVHYCMALVEQGQFGKAIGMMLEGREAAIKADSLYSLARLHNTLGWAYGTIYRLDKAIEFNELSLKSANKLRGPRPDVLLEIDSFARLNLADIFMLTKDMAKAREYLETVYGNAQKAEYFMARTRWKARCLIALGELWQQLGDYNKAESFLAELDAHGFTDRFPFAKHQVRAGRLKGALLMGRGSTDDAESELKLTLQRALQLENPTEVWKCHQTLGNLYALQDKRKKAHTEFHATSVVVQVIADGLFDPELKEGFLNSAPIREVFAQAE